MTAYEYALLRYRHSPTAGELVNIGVVMWLPRERQLLYSIRDHYRRLSAFIHDFEGVSYRQMIRHLTSRIEQVKQGLADPQGTMFDQRQSTIDKILRVIVSDPDSCFQWSLVMAGRTDDPERRLGQLMQEFILRHEEALEKIGRNEKQIWSTVERRLKGRSLIVPGKLQEDVKIVGAHDYSWTFKAGWHNGRRQVLEPISFDYLKAQQLTEKATMWIGRLVSLAEAEFEMTAVVAPPQKSEHRPVYLRAVERLRTAPKLRDVVEEERIDSLIPKIEDDLAHR